MSNTKATEVVTETEETTALDRVAHDVARIQSASAGMTPATREQMAMLAELNALDQQLENLDTETTSPTEMARTGVVVDIHDAYPAEIKDGDELKSVCVFVCVEQETGLQHLVMQSLNSIREVYVKRFGGYKVLGAPDEIRIMRGYRFVVSDNPKHRKAGNSAILLQKVR